MHLMFYQPLVNRTLLFCRCKEIRALIFYSNSEQREQIEDFVSKKGHNNVALLVINENLPKVRKMDNIYILKKTNFYHGLEGAREIVNHLHDLRYNGKSIFRDILTTEGYSVLEIIETSFINDFLGPILNKINALILKVEELIPEEIRIFKPYGVYERIIANIFPQKVNANINKLGTMTGSQVFHFSLNLRGFPIKFEVRDKLQISTMIYALFSNICALSRGFWYRCSYGKHYKMKPFNARKRIVFFTVNKKQVDTVIPLVKSLQNGCELEPLVIDWGSDAVKPLNENNIDFEQFDSYFDFELLTKVMKTVRQITYRWSVIKERCNAIRNIKYSGYDISDTVIGILDRIFYFYVYPIVRDYLIAKKITKKLNVDAIFVTNERESRAKSCVFAAKSLGVRAYNCQRGIIGDHPEVGPISTNKMFVNGNYYENVLVKRGVAPDKIVVTGNPRFDLYYAKLLNMNFAEVKSKIYKHLGIDPVEKVFLVIEQPIILDVTPIDKMLMVRGSLKAAKTVGARAIIKLHPTQNTDDIERKVVIAMNKPETIIIKDEVDLLDLLIVADLVIIRNSTVGLDAILLSKPLITTKLVDRGRDLIPYASFGVALEARTETEIIRHANSTFQGDNYFETENYRRKREKFVEEHLYFSDGMSAERIIDIITKDLQE